MTEANDYAELVAKAEKAVAAVKDPELKLVAFQKVLDDLLTSDSAPKTTGHVARHGPKRKPRKSASGKAEKKAGRKAYIKEMVEEGFFKKQKTIAQVKAELENRGYHITLTSLSGPLQQLCQTRILRRQRTSSDGGKTTFAYSNW